MLFLWSSEITDKCRSSEKQKQNPFVKHYYSQIFSVALTLTCVKLPGDEISGGVLAKPLLPWPILKEQMSFKISVKKGVNVYPTTTVEEIKFAHNSLYNK